VSFSLLNSKDQVVYAGTEETVQKMQLQEFGDVVSGCSSHTAQTSCWLASGRAWGGDCRGGEICMIR